MVFLWQKTPFIGNLLYSYYCIQDRERGKEDADDIDVNDKTGSKNKK
jgi:hypothetical protein